LAVRRRRSAEVLARYLISPLFLARRGVRWDSRKDSSAAWLSSCDVELHLLELALVGTEPEHRTDDFHRRLGGLKAPGKPLSCPLSAEKIPAERTLWARTAATVEKAIGTMAVSRPVIPF
jgi:hypothetical protein